MKNLITVSLVFLLTINFAFAKNVENPRINELFEVLAYDSTSFEPTGAVCEKVAVFELEEFYPKSDFQILSGLEYHNSKEAIGELDVVIINKKSSRVEVVLEVKCWKSFKGGLKKAKEQRNRFINHLRYDIKIVDKEKNRYNKDLFMQVREFKTVGQNGALNEGFDHELSLNLKELMILRNKLLDCYAEDLCPRAK